ncbi:MAG: alkaline phosphatase family protein [Terracidiphilus sp.]
MDPIRHVIVLMLENASFDRMLGLLPGIDGVDPAHPRTNPDFPTPNLIAQTVTTQPAMALDPEHDLDDCLRQIAGHCQGFVSNFSQHYPQATLAERAEVMGYYSPQFLTVLNTLAKSFLTCDRWFSSLPGPTWPNRFFAHSGTSLGHTTMPSGIFDPAIHLYDQPTVYQRLSEAGVPWSIYYGDFPQSIVLTEQWKYPAHYHRMSQFYVDTAGSESSFSSYCFIEPTYFGPEQNDQHPPSHVLRGEALLANVYNAICGNQELWQSSLLVILYDEHGGFYDHVCPPTAVPPDQHIAEFSFAEYGVRVPAVLVSLWIKPGVASEVFDHTSVLKYATDKWSLGPLGARVAAARTFASYIAAGISSPRTDTPETIAAPAPPPEPLQTGMNVNQTALVSFSRYLETHIQSLSLAAGKTSDEISQEAGARLLRGLQGAEQSGQSAIERVERWMELRKMTNPQ